VSDYTRPEDSFGAVTIPELLESAALGRRGVTLLDAAGHETPLPYSLLAMTARRVATALVRLGVRRGDRVALVSSTNARFLLSLFGVWRAGAVPVIIAPPHRLSDMANLVAEIRARLDHVDARCVVVADSFGGFVAKRIGTRQPVVTCGDLVTEQDDAPPAITGDPDELAYLQFTSGTTGSSRAVALTQRQVLTNAAVCSERLLLDGERSVHASWAPLYHDLGLVALLASVATRIRLILQPPEAFLTAPDSWLDAMSSYRVTSTVAPNFAYGLAADGIRRRPRDLDLSALRVCGDGSEPTRQEAVERFIAEGARYGLRPEAITPMYGLAEATLSVTMGDRFQPMLWDHVEREGLRSAGKAVPALAGAVGTRTLAVIGTAVPGVTVSVQDEHGVPLPGRKVGELCVRGPSVMTGYWRDPAASAEVLRGGWLHTGDLGYSTPDGLVVCGRIKDMIIIGGANLYPEDYEYVAIRIDGVSPVCAAFAVPETERMIVAVELVNGADPVTTVHTVLARLRDELGHAPDKVVAVPRNSIARTSSGKVQRQRCRDGYLNGSLTVLADAAR
jgi:fatty-acyl-CoA synthase